MSKAPDVAAAVKALDRAHAFEDVAFHIECAQADLEPA